MNIIVYQHIGDTSNTSNTQVLYPTHFDTDKDIIYFDDDQSTGLFYTKDIYIINPVFPSPTESNDPYDIKFSLNSDIFFFIDTTKMVAGRIPQLTEVRSNDILIKHEDINQTLPEVIKVAVGCMSDVQGEIETSITISRVRRDTGKSDLDLKMKICANFYNQREELETLLQNQGVTLPKDIIKAFYDTDVNEAHVDWVVLNRKYKELLLNIVDIIHKKGSYKSIIDSINWFEYGDSIKIHEYWMKDGVKRQKELNLLYDEIAERLISHYTKSTYISLSLSLNEETGEIVNGTPILRECDHKWNIEDLQIKMLYLGVFFSSFFLPIHLDLLYSCVERKIYSSNIPSLHVYMTTWNRSNINPWSWEYDQTAGRKVFKFNPPS